MASPVDPQGATDRIALQAQTARPVEAEPFAPWLNADSLSQEFLRKGKRMRGKTAVLSVEGAEKIAISALTYIATDDELCQRFLSITGMTPQTLRTAAASPSFLSAVLDFVAAHEPTLTAFASHAGIQPGDVDSARRTLGGGDWERETA